MSFLFLVISGFHLVCGVIDFRKLLLNYDWARF